MEIAFIINIYKFIALYYKQTSKIIQMIEKNMQRVLYGAQQEKIKTARVATTNTAED